jgi:hypothetical protein
LGTVHGVREAGNAPWVRARAPVTEVTGVA